MGIGQRYASVCQQVARLARECGRDAGDVRVIAVSKTVGVPAVQEAIDAGAHDFAENRAELLAEKAAAYPGQTWHCIGNIQSRKIPQMVEFASLIHSVYQERHLRKIDEEARKRGKVQELLIEVNVSGEESKDGCAPDEALALVQIGAGLEHVRVRGLMTMAPQAEDAVVERTFSGLAALFWDIKGQLAPQAAADFTELSMGMSQDWPIAIRYGATMIRVGRAIFSDEF